MKTTLNLDYQLLRNVDISNRDALYSVIDKR